MMEFVLVFVLGALIALFGWWIGSRFRLPDGQGSGPVRFEILLSDIDNANRDQERGDQEGGDDARPADMRLVRRSFKRASGLISKATTGNKYATAPEIRIGVRRIGRWTFARSIDHRRDDQGTAQPGVEFLKDNQWLFQGRSVGGSPGINFAPHPYALGNADYSSRTFGLDCITLDPSLPMDDQTRHLAAYLACLGVARTGGGEGALLDFAEEQLGRSGEGDRDKSSRPAMSRAQKFEVEYMRAWLWVERGIELGDTARLSSALGLYQALTDGSANIKSDDVSQITRVQMAAHGARAALSLYELAPRHPEHLLEGHEYCANAIRLLGDRGPGPGPDHGSILPTLLVLRARIERCLAVHDASLKGLDRAAATITKAASLPSGVEGALSPARLAVEAGHQALARAHIGGDTRHLHRGLGHFEAGAAEFKAELGADEMSLERVTAVKGAVTCALEIGVMSGDGAMIRRAQQMAVKICVPMAALEPSRRSPRLDFMQMQLTLLRGRALGALGVLGGDDKYFQAALKEIDRADNLATGFEMASSGFGEIAAHERARARAGIALDRADLTPSAEYLRDGVAALRAANRMASDTADWQLSFGLGRSLLALAAQSRSRSAIAEAELHGRSLLRLAEDGQNGLRRGEAEIVLADILAVKSERSPSRRAEYLREAAKRVRRALDLTPRRELPRLWAERQKNLGGLLARYGALEGDMAGLEAAVAAYQKALEEIGEGEAGARVPVLNHLAQSLLSLGAQTRDRATLDRADAVFSQAYDLGAIHHLRHQVRIADESLARLRRARHT